MIDRWRVGSAVRAVVAEDELPVDGRDFGEVHRRAVRGVDEETIIRGLGDLVRAAVVVASEYQDCSRPLRQPDP